MLKLILLHLTFLLPQIYAQLDADKMAFMQDWDLYMRSFVPDDMISFEIEAQGQEIIIETIKEPTNIRGAYFISLFSKETIDFQIVDPDNVTVFEKLKKREAVYSVNVTKKGDYQFIFGNQRSSEKKSLTFSLDNEKQLFDALSSEDIDPINQNVTNVYEQVLNTYYGSKLQSQRIELGLAELKQFNYSVMTFTFVETVFICSVSFWQVWYIKKILSDRRLV